MKQKQTTPPDGPVKNDDTESAVSSTGGCPSVKTEPLPANNDTKSDTEVTVKTGDIFDDLAALGCSLEDAVPSEKLLTSLPVRKPKRDEWIRVHAEIATPANLYEDGDERELYVVLPVALEALHDVIRHVELTLAVNYKGAPFLWPVPVPSERQNWKSCATAYAAARRAASEWIRLSWDGADYEVYRRRSAAAEPVWPEEIGNASGMLRFASKVGAFEIIDSLDHPVIKRHLGLD